MIYLIWGIINIALLLCWLWIAFSLLFKRRDFTLRKIRLYTAVFLFGLLGLFSNKTKESQAQTIQHSRPVSLSIVTTEKTLINHITICLYRDKETGEILPSSDSTLTGFVAGIKWNMSGLSEREGKLEINGILSWSLIGVEIYRQPKKYSSIIPAIG